MRFRKHHLEDYLHLEGAAVKQIFDNPEFGKIRVMNVNGEPWFVGKDVALALGYTKPENAV